MPIERGRTQSMPVLSAVLFALAAAGGGFALAGALLGAPWASSLGFLWFNVAFWPAWFVQYRASQRSAAPAT